MRRVHAHHEEERLAGVALAVAVENVAYGVLCLIYRRPLVRIVTIAVVVPVVRVLVLVECAVRQPVVESVTLLRLGVGIPYGALCLYVFAWVLWRVLGRELHMKLADVSAVVARLAHHVAPAYGVGKPRRYRTA